MDNAVKTFRITLIFLMLALLPSCRAVRDFMHDGKVVARVGSHDLYLSELESFIPNGVSPEDSAHLAEQYIRTWATGQLYVDMATQQLSKPEKDVSKELEDYKNSLLRYRYEQRYVNERLDTTVSRSEIEKYYEDHEDLFILDVPILKARFLDIMEDSPNYETIRRRMSSNEYEDIAEADSLAYSSALRYVDWSDRWVDAVTLAREFGTDYNALQTSRLFHRDARGQGRPEDSIRPRDPQGRDSRTFGLLRGPHKGYHHQRQEARSAYDFGTRLAGRCPCQRKLYYLF